MMMMMMMTVVKPLKSRPVPYPSQNVACYHTELVVGNTVMSR